MHGMNMGTHGTGARKNKRKTGNRGGKGMSGSGKRADHKKTLVTKLYGHGYFGKMGITSIGTRRDKRERVNLSTIMNNLEKLGKKTSKGWEIKLPKAKILNSNVEIKEKLIITSLDASKGAIENIKKAGGDIILPKASASEKGSERKKEVKKSESLETEDKE